MAYEELMKKIFLFLILATFLSACVDTAIDAYEESKVEYAKQKTFFKADKGSVGAQYESGKLNCCGESSKKDPKEALRWFCLAARNGSADAMYMIGFIYENSGLFDAGSLRKDEVLALAYYKLALNAGNLESEKSYNKLVEKSTIDKVQKADTLVAMWPKVYCEVK